MSRAAAVLAFATSVTVAGAVGFRAATFNIGAHFNSEGNIDYSLNDPGTADHDSVRSILARINADVVALQEIAPADVAGDPDDLDALAASLGYGHLHTAPVTQEGGLAGPIDTTLRVTFLSRFPLLARTSVRSPAGAKELTRLFPAVTVDVPGTTRDPVLISGHLKSGTATADRFRRAIELRRLAQHLSTRGLGNGDNFIILGDFNLSSNQTVFDAPPTGLPASYSLGADVTFPVTYSTNPLYYFSTPGVVRLDPRQLDQSPATYQSGSTIDLLLVSPALAGRPIRTEIYNSALDSAGAGLPKSGQPPAAGTSATASDHYAVFGDFELDEDFPPLALALSTAAIPEGGALTLTVTLPQAQPSATSISLVSSDPAAAAPAVGTVTIPAGGLSTTVALATTRNFLADGGRMVRLTAFSQNHTDAVADLLVSDIDVPYPLAGPGRSAVETFDGFQGAHDPAPWSTSGGIWRGLDAGSLGAVGFRSYGTAADGSLGFLGSAGSAVASFVNASGETLTDLAISFSAEQWRAINGGANGRLQVTLLTDGAEIPLPALDFTPSTQLPDGPRPGGGPVVRSAIVHGLAVRPGTAFQLRFSFSSEAAGGAMPADVFINEFHYDNEGADTGEFVEIVAGPGFSGATAAVSLVLYNGADGKSYGTHALSTFTAGAVTPAGYRLYSKAISGIQNGDPDGFAVVVDGVVTQFISYGGSFTATNGPALNLVSTDIGVKQSAEPTGQAALGLTGSGGTPAAFSWMKFSGVPHSPGQPNAGQTFVLPAQSQGFSFDNLAVTFLPSRDSDGDGYTDAQEAAFGTDPADAASRFAVSLTTPAANTTRLTFPTLPGRSYVVESSADLTAWTVETTASGSGATLALDFPRPAGDLRRFYRIRVVRP